MADVAPEPDHTVVESTPLRLRQQRHEILFHIDRIRPYRQAQTIADTLYVRIHGQSLIDAIRPVKNDVGRFSGHAGQGRQLRHAAGNLAAVGFHDAARRAQKIFCLAAEKTRTANDAFQIARQRPRQFARAWPAPEKLGRNSIDTRIGTLRRKNSGNQQLPGVAGRKMRGRNRITRLQRGQGLPGALPRAPGQFRRLHNSVFMPQATAHGNTPVSAFLRRRIGEPGENLPCFLGRPVYSCPAPCA